MQIAELQVRRDAFRTTRLATREAPEPKAGEALLRIDSFALTANNISYALSGDMIGYWKFFPAEDPWGIVPVWGFADVVASRAPELAEGERLWGFLPMASHLLIQPEKVTSGALIDAAAHRQPLPEVYNRYSRTAGDAPALQALADERSLLFPLFVTSFILFDYLEDNSYFGAEQVIIGSASSKTGFGLGELLNRLARDKVRVIGLTSKGNRAFVERLGFYDEVRSYEEIGAIADRPTAFVDMSGSGPVIAAVHERLGANVRASVSVGATHWEEKRHKGAVEGAPPTFFFAPAQILKRESDWGPGEILRRAYTQCALMAARAKPHLTIRHGRGPEAVEAAYAEMVEGRQPPNEGLILSLNA